MRKFLFFFFLINIIIMPLTGVGNEPVKETLRIGINTFPASLNPVYITDETSQSIANKIFNSLFYFDCRGRVEKGLAEAYWVENNGKKIIIELKKNIFFPRGRELNSDDVVSTIKLLKDKEFKYPYAADISFVKEARKIGKFKFSLILQDRLAAWKNYLTFFILNAEEINVAPGKFRHTALSGTGFYKIKEIIEPRKIVLELNKPGKNPLLYRYIEYIIVKNTNLVPLKLINDEIDICELQPENIPAYKNIQRWQKKFTIANYKKFGYTYLVFNLKNAKITRDTRRIFYNVLTHGDFINKFLTGRGEQVKTPFLLLNDKIEPEEFAVENPGKPVRLKVLTNSESKLRKDFVLFLRTELESNNIFLEPLFLEYHTFLQYLKNSRFDIAVSAFLLEIDFDMKEIFQGGSSFNYAKYNNPRMDLLLDRGLRELDSEKRENIYQEAQRVWLNDLPLIPLFNLYYYMGISRRIKIPPETYELIGSSGDFLFNIDKWLRDRY